MTPFQTTGEQTNFGKPTVGSTETFVLSRKYFRLQSRTASERLVQFLKAAHRYLNLFMDFQTKRK